MEYSIIINNDLDNETRLPETFADLEEAMEIVDAIKEGLGESWGVATGFYNESGRFVKMYYTGPLELL